MESGNSWIFDSKPLMVLTAAAVGSAFYPTDAANEMALSDIATSESACTQPNGQRSFDYSVSIIEFQRLGCCNIADALARVQS
jgi:hypothetical protein